MYININYLLCAIKMCFIFFIINHWLTRYHNQNIFNKKIQNPNNRIQIFTNTFPDLKILEPVSHITYANNFYNLYLIRFGSCNSFKGLNKTQQVIFALQWESKIFIKNKSAL